MDVRRDELVQEGKPVFEVGKILSDWAIYTSLEFENLGFHQSACAQPVIFFQDADLTYPEQYYPEGSASVTWTVRITEPLPVDIEISIDPLAVGHQFIVPDVPGATFAEDYKLSPSIFDVLTWVTSTEFTNYEIVEIIYQDDLIEGEEGAGVWLSVIDDNGTGTTVSTTKRVFDFVIFDPLMSAENTQPANFKLFPTIVTTNTSEIQWIAEDFSEITSVKIIGISGKIMLEENCNGRTSVTLPGLPGKGLYYVQFFTAKGSFTKKILKI